MGLCLSTAYIIFYYLENKKVSELDDAQMETERILGEPEIERLDKYKMMQIFS